MAISRSTASSSRTIDRRASRRPNARRSASRSPQPAAAPAAPRCTDKALSRTAGEGAEPSEAGEGVSADTHPHPPSASRWVPPSPAVWEREFLRRIEFAVLAGDQIVGQGKTRHCLEALRPRFKIWPVGDVEPAFGHEHHAPPAADIGDRAMVTDQPIAVL